MCGFLVVSGEIESREKVEKSFETIHHRGPDHSNLLYLDKNQGLLAFHRLAIMDLGPLGNQPFSEFNSKIHLVCNGEIYNYKHLKDDLGDSFSFKSHSDCEVLLPLYERDGLEKLCHSLDGEYAFVLFDEREKKFKGARDPMGIRPLFYGTSKTSGEFIFASEVKALLDLCCDIKPFPPGHYFDGDQFVSFLDLTKVEKVVDAPIEEITKKIHDLFVAAVEKRLDSDAPLGFLLSGGLDSSLVCAIASRLLDKPIKTFAVGITENPIDTKYAKIVSDFLGTEHHEYLFSREQTLSALSELIKTLETWDITTIRAAMGMYMICQYVKEETDVKVILTGEVSDEIFGYKYTDFAPSPEEFQKEAAKRVEELYIYDVLRADRSISAHSLEARVPFSDTDFVQYVMSIDPKIKMNSYGVGKYLLRKAFSGQDYLPEDILMREKAAFSDAVGHSLVDWLKEYAEGQYSEEEFGEKSKSYSHGRPFTKESLLYREIFEGHFPGQSHLIKDFWMPNKEWEGCNVNDPSARALSNYGKSGE